MHNIDNFEEIPIIKMNSSSLLLVRIFEHINSLLIKTIDIC